MTPSNLERLIRLADEVFAARNDPDQLNVNATIIRRLQRMHPFTVQEFSNDQGPVAWVLVIPTTLELMHKFIRAEISEKNLFDLTPEGVAYEALYLCSALVLEEYRRKGIVKQLVMNAISAIGKDHPLQAIFVWPFTREGEIAAEAIAKYTSLPLFKRTKRSKFPGNKNSLQTNH